MAGMFVKEKQTTTKKRGKGAIHTVLACHSVCSYQRPICFCVRGRKVPDLPKHRVLYELPVSRGIPIYIWTAKIHFNDLHVSHQVRVYFYCEETSALFYGLFIPFQLFLFIVYVKIGSSAGTKSREILTQTIN